VSQDSNTTQEAFTAAYGRFLEFLPTYEAAAELRETEIARRTGIPPHWTFRTEDEAEAHLTAMRAVDRETGFAELIERREALELAVDPLVRKILNAPASDLLGLALKANAVATAMRHLWRLIPAELDWPEELVRDLIESVCIVAGAELIAPPPAQPPVPRSDLN
jgi:hypothetical protein